MTSPIRASSSTNWKSIALALAVGWVIGKVLYPSRRDDNGDED